MSQASRIPVAGRPATVVQTGRGPDLLLVHSLLAERSSFDQVLPALAARFRVTAPDLPGYGGTAPLPEPVKIEDYADWVAELIRTLDLPTSTTVLGNGFGGFVATALAVRHGALFDKLIVADALPGFPAPAKEPLRALAARVASQGMEGALDIAIRRMFPEDYIAANPGIVAERKEALLRAADAGAFQRAALALTKLDLASELAKIRNPTLVICGALDQTTPPQIARQLAEGISGARYEEIPECGHCPQVQKPDALVAHALAFAA
ncbi:MAG: alpha/beta hydrolase [Betaproteobacteria bacterium]|jgi:pimeloyl-ACP methyl ester carboxylesterase|nr:alpha/beta hydrolase [Betaproteobacteria bacterium]